MENKKKFCTGEWEGKVNILGSEAHRNHHNKSVLLVTLAI